ncbi:MAG: Alpha-galactosidase [Planctomycetes bacterium ADurb.Bin126]|nr:MAG: Alpha-galactosidase [Planctomycetes bacterium ADurb.Bin126]
MFRARQMSLVAAGLGLFACAAAGVQASPEELQHAREWVRDVLLSDQAKPVFSFVLDGRASNELLKTWRRSSKVSAGEGQTTTVLEYVPPEGGLRVRCEAVVYERFPVVEWVVEFRNEGPGDTPILENVLSMDLALTRAEGAGEFVLHHAAGSQANRSDYAPRRTDLPPKGAKRLGGSGGRPTNADWSYFNLAWGDGGAIVSVGWPGQWFAQFMRDAGRSLALAVGQERVRTRLRPGETFRTPRMTVLLYRGERYRSQNLWRRWMAAHAMPRPGGKLPPPQFAASSSRAYEEMIKANEANQMMHIDRYLEERLGIDYWWMDAGWYVQQRGWPQVGTWEVDTKRFPRGLKPISDHAHRRGVKIIVWFEPERVAPGTWLHENRPQWLLRSGPHAGGTDGLRSWSRKDSGEPAVTHNPTGRDRTYAEIVWPPGRLSFHPGAKGEYSAVRWTAPGAGTYDVRAEFAAIDKKTTTDVHVLAGGRPVHDEWIDLHGQGRTSAYAGKLELKQGETVDFVVGFGNGSYVCDSTGLDVRITSADGRAYDAAKDFNPEKNPAGAWSYGHLKPGPAPHAGTFQLYERARTAGGDDMRLLNLGNDEARSWLTEHVAGLLDSQGIDLYRQDFNIDPLAFWRAADAEDRQGMTENRYVQGYLAYWDELRRRRPTMLIDSCASGGRRNDLETMRRSVPLWRSDYAFEPIGHQGMTYGLSLWLPYHGTGTVACANAGYYGGGKTPVEPYAFWSNTAPGFGSGIDIRVREIDYDALRRLLAAWRQLTRFYYDDFYPLVPYTQEQRDWMAWQFNSPERREAAVQAFRRAECAQEQTRLKLRDLEADATYTITLLDGGEGKPVEGETRLTGRELMDAGLPITLKTKPAAVVVILKAPRP